MMVVVVMTMITTMTTDSKVCGVPTLCLALSSASTSCNLATYLQGRYHNFHKTDGETLNLHKKILIESFLFAQTSKYQRIEGE